MCNTLRYTTLNMAVCDYLEKIFFYPLQLQSTTLSGHSHTPEHCQAQGLAPIKPRTNVEEYQGYRQLHEELGVKSDIGKETHTAFSEKKLENYYYICIDCKLYIKTQELKLGLYHNV